MMMQSLKCEVSAHLEFMAQFLNGGRTCMYKRPLSLPKLVHHVDIPHNLVMHDLWQEFSLVPSANFTLSPESCVLTLV